MEEIIKTLTCILTFYIMVCGAQSGFDKDIPSFTSKARTIDEWLFSDDLFPGHAIPQNVAHKDAIRMFTKLVDDHELLTEAYNRYRRQHNKDTEDDLKYDASKHHFKDNLHFIFQHNLNHDAGQFGFQVGVNIFADMSKEEMGDFLGANDRMPVQNLNSSMAQGPQAPPHQAGENGPPTLLTTSTAYPMAFDLRDLNVVTSIKNQKKCGSCVHFSHGGMMETLYAVQNEGEHINVSEQMMLDCAIPKHGYVNNGGCNGNIMEDSGQFLVDHGVTHEAAYKYIAKVENCSKDGKEVVAKLKDYYQVEPTVEAFKSTLFNDRKPIAAAFLVYPTFMFYRTGVFDQCTPPFGYIGGHAILIVGYGHFFDQGYWIVKNSWGQGWGEKGYFRYLAGSNFCRFERWGFTGTLA